MVGVWLGCISVVLTTVRESATPGSKESTLSVRRVVVELFVSRAREGVSTHMASNMQLITHISAVKKVVLETRGFSFAATFALGPLGGEKPLHSSTPPAPY